MLRVNPDGVADALAAIERVQQDQQTALLQIATGRRVNKPSDDPAAAAAVVQNHDRSQQADQFLHSISGIKAQLQSADATVNSVVTALQRAISLGVQGGNGTLSTGDRAALTQELQGIQSQVVSLANFSFQGSFVFAGTNVKTPPYALDNTTASGVRYTGMAAWDKTLSESDMWKVTAFLTRVEKLPPAVQDYWKKSSGVAPPAESDEGHEGHDHADHK